MFFPLKYSNAKDTIVLFLFLVKKTYMTAESKERVWFYF